MKKTYNVLKRKHNSKNTCYIAFMPVGLSICFFKKAIWDVETNIFTDIFYSGMLAINPWNEQPWFSTGGTRTKTYVQFLDGKFYYFKR